MMALRKAAECGYGLQGWLESGRSFSLAYYRDPAAGDTLMLSYEATFALGNAKDAEMLLFV